MSSPARLVLLAVALIAGVALAFVYFFRDREPEGVLRASGTIEATEVDSSFQIAGKVSEVLVREGDPVKQGDVIARMSSDELQSRVSQIQASLDANSSQALQQQAALEMRRGVVENQIRQAQVQADASRAVVERLREAPGPRKLRWRNPR